VIAEERFDHHDDQFVSVPTERKVGTVQFYQKVILRANELRA
jgi:hypothetical protein